MLFCNELYTNYVATKEKPAGQVVLNRCLQGSTVGKFNLLRLSHHHPLCVISQSQEALNSQSLHWSSQKSSLTHTLTSFQPCLLGTPPTHHLLMLFHVSTQPNHLPIWCTFLPSCFSYQNLSFFSWMNLPSMSSSNFLWHGNHQYWNS